MALFLEVLNTHSCLELQEENGRSSSPWQRVFKSLAPAA